MGKLQGRKTVPPPVDTRAFIPAFSKLEFSFEVHVLLPIDSYSLAQGLLVDCCRRETELTGKHPGIDRVLYCDS